MLFLSLVPCVNMETADFERWSYFMSFKFELYYTLFREESTRGNLHYHNFYEIVYYESGAGYTTIEGKKSHYTPGTYAFLPPNTAHDEFCETDSNIHILTFSGCGPGEQQLPAGLYADQDSTVFRCISKIRDEYTFAMPYMSQFSNIYCEELYNTALRNTDSSNVSGSINYVITYIRRFFNEDLSVTKLADMCGYSVRHFRQIFKRKTGCSPSEYILKRRLDNAKGMLAFTSENIVNVASQCGFCSSSQFAHLFKMEMGVSPTEYRKQNNNIMNSTSDK